MRDGTRWAGIIVLGSTLAIAAGGCASWNHASADKSASTEHRGPVQATSDTVITAKVKTKFAADDLVKARRIDVDTMRGVVTLNGTVSSTAERDRAISIARNTDGVSDVKSNLKVSG